jgi:hypothetical protein
VSLGCVLLIVGSALLQIVGLFLVARDLWRVQHRELGTPRWVQAAQARWRRLLRRPGKVHSVSGHVAVSTEAAGRLSVRRAAATPTVEARLAALEANLAELEKDTESRFADVEQRLTEANRRADEARAHADRLRQELEQARRDELRQTMPWQWIGTGLFALGALLAMCGSLAC